MPTRRRSALAIPTRIRSTVTSLLTRLVEEVPTSDERPVADPRARARTLASKAARKATAISTGLALPPGAVGLVTIMPDLMAIWRIQAQLVADVASVYGKTASLTRESMVHCLFRHGSAALLRDVVVRTGERFVVERVSLRGMQRLLAKIGVQTTHRVLGSVLARAVPLLGAAAIGAYAYYDTAQVGANTIEFFSAQSERRGGTDDQSD